MCKTQKKKTFHFITLSQEQLKVQYIFEERHRSMKENCLWGRCKKSIKKTNNSTFSATHTYIKTNTCQFFLLFFFYAPFPNSYNSSQILTCEVLLKVEVLGVKLITSQVWLKPAWNLDGSNHCVLFLRTPLQAFCKPS